MSRAVSLYSYWRSSASWRVRLALGLKGIPYEYKAVNIIQKQQLEEDYIKINPLKEVPTLLIDGHVLCQSVAIIEYLEETRPNPPLFPKNPLLRARVRQIVETIAGDIQPVQTLRVIDKVGEDLKSTWAKTWIDFGFEGLEKVLKETAGRYCVGDEITAADCLLVPQVYNARRFSVDMTKFPTITHVDQELSKLPVFQQAHPDQQPDAVIP